MQAAAFQPMLTQPKRHRHNSHNAVLPRLSANSRYANAKQTWRYWSSNYNLNSPRHFSAQRCCRPANGLSTRLTVQMVLYYHRTAMHLCYYALCHFSSKAYSLKQYNNDGHSLAFPYFPATLLPPICKVSSRFSCGADTHSNSCRTNSLGCHSHQVPKFARHRTITHYR